VLHIAKRSTVTLGVSGALAVVLLTAGCGGGDDGGADAGGTASGSTSASGSGSAAGPLGTPNPATGSPIVIGTTNAGKTTAIDTSNQQVSAESAAKYANDYLGGINGHKIVVKRCDHQNTPSIEADCANQFIQAGAAAVAEGAGDDVTIKTLSDAGTPLVMSVGASAVALSAPDVFSVGNPLFVYGGPAAYAKTQGVKKAALLVIDVPGASGPAKVLGPKFFKAAGIDLQVITIAPGTADMAPQVATADAAGATFYYVLGDITFDTSAIKAIKAGAPTAKISAYGTGISADGSKSIPGGYEGVTALLSNNLDPTTEEFKLYSAVLAKYGGVVEGQGASGYTAMMGLIRALNAGKAAGTTPADALAAIKAAPAVPVPLTQGATFQCTGTVIASSPNICSTAGTIAAGTAAGGLEDYKLLDDTSIYN
jgi:branched-chain amino acid transport system substrate-binding protein